MGGLYDFDISIETLQKTLLEAAEPVGETKPPPRMDAERTLALTREYTRVPAPVFTREPPLKDVKLDAAKLNKLIRVLEPEIPALEAEIKRAGPANQTLKLFAVKAALQTATEILQRLKANNNHTGRNGSHEKRKPEKAANRKASPKGGIVPAGKVPKAGKNPQQSNSRKRRGH